MTNAKDLQALYDYGDWANGKLFDVVSQLTPEHFIQPVARSYGSVRNTLGHILSAEWGWLDRCGGAQDANSCDYLTELQRHAQELAVSPAESMPWSYRETLQQVGV